MPSSVSDVADSIEDSQFPAHREFTEYSGPNVEPPASQYPVEMERTKQAALQDEGNIEALRLSCCQLMGHLAEALRELSASRISEEKRRQEFVDFKTALISAVIDKEAARYETGEVRFRRLRRTLLNLLAGY